MMRILVTGGAGFIGAALSQRLLDMGHEVVALDCLNDYYDVQLKKARLARLQHPHFTFVHGDLADKPVLDGIFSTGITHVVNLAAQAGVRYSLENPAAYVQSNVVGFGHLLECCRAAKVAHLVYASSSSVYGLNASMPFSEHDNVDHPISLYAATKKSGELMAHAYSHLYGLPSTGLRFFTVYGPWGRPDMALFMFTCAILEGKPIRVFNHGNMLRDFTYIDDIVEGVLRVIPRPASPDPTWDPKAPNPSTSSAPWRIYNIGNNNVVELGRFIEVLEAALGREAIKEYLPMQPGDVHGTWADVSSLEALTSFTPETSIETGITNFVSWYRDYYKI